MNEKLKREFVKAASNYTYYLNILNDLTNQEKIDNYILTELNELLELNNQSVMEDRFNHFKVPETRLSDYEQKLISIGKSDKLVLAGIRHVGGNSKKPFIYIWPNFKIEEHDIKDIIEHISPYFEVFNPLYINFWISPNLLSTYDIKNNITVSQKMFIADINSLQSKKSSNKNNELTLKKVEDNDYYSWYEKEYRLFHQMNPGLKDKVPVNDIELMESCREEDLLYYGMINDKKVGIIAAEKKDIFGIRGIYINEIMIAEDYRGNKLSENLLDAFIDRLLKSTNVLWCHIDSENIPSTKAALHSGQKIFSVECFYKLQ